MNWVVFLFGSGWVLFPGVVLVLLGLLPIRHLRLRRILFLGVWVGLVLVAFSATPWPWFVYAGLYGATACWLFAEARWPRGLRVLRGMVLVAWLIGTIVEATHHVPLRLIAAPSRVLIFGDSVTAGTGEPGTITWPKLLAKTHGLEIDDRSQMGARVATAVKKAESKPVPEGVVLIEVGGNDLLGGTSAEEFEANLSKLLKHLDRPGRTLVMFELPLPPTYNLFGEIQRRLAERHNVELIPKWQFLSILTTANATEDGIHLTQLGQQRMAELVWSVMGADAGADGNAENDSGRETVGA